MTIKRSFLFFPDDPYFGSVDWTHNHYLWHVKIVTIKKMCFLSIPNQEQNKVANSFTVKKKNVCFVMHILANEPSMKKYTSPTRATKWLEANIFSKKKKTSPAQHCAMQTAMKYREPPLSHKLCILCDRLLLLGSKTTPNYASIPEMFSFAPRWEVVIERISSENEDLFHFTPEGWTNEVASVVVIEFV